MKKNNLIIFFSLICIPFIISCNSSTNHTVQQSKAVPSTGFIYVNGADIFYKSIGEGEPIIVLHGGPGMDHTYFLPHLAMLTDTYQLIFFDQRAAGKSSFDLDSSQMNMDIFVEDIEAIRKTFGLESVNLMGHSWGGLLAMWYAKQHADRLDRLILVGTLPANKEYEAEAAQILQERTLSEDRIALQILMKSEAFQNRETSALEKMYRLNFGASFYKRDYLDSLTLIIPENFVERQQKLMHLMGDLADYDLHQTLQNITAPVLLIHGEYDATPKSAIKKIEAELSDVQLDMLPNTGHFPFIESKEEFRRSLDTFWEKSKP